MPPTARDTDPAPPAGSPNPLGQEAVSPHGARRNIQETGSAAADRSSPLVIFGIDPGSAVTGYGAVRVEGAALSLLGAGVIRPRGETLAQRLLDLYERLRSLLEEWRPDEVAVEEPFTRVNARSAFILGKAQAAALLAAAHAGAPVFEYTPAAVKQAVTNYGRSDKEQIQEMVRLQFGLAAPPRPADAADALAVALCHIAHRRTAAMLQRSPGQRG